MSLEEGTFGKRLNYGNAIDDLLSRGGDLLEDNGHWGHDREGCIISLPASSLFTAQ